jgi:hypothetical protein
MSHLILLISILFLSCNSPEYKSPCDQNNPNFIFNFAFFSLTTNQGYCGFQSSRRNSITGGQQANLNKISGTITGLTKQNLILNSGTTPNQTLTINANSTNFEFPTELATGSNYSISMTNNSNGNVCTITNPTGSIPSTNLSISCRPIYNLYVMASTAGVIRSFEADETGALTEKSTINTGIITPSLFLWNNKHVIIGEGTDLKTYLREPNGSLTLVQNYTSTIAITGLNGTPSVHPNGRFFYVRASGGNTAPIVKMDIDTNGILSNEISYATGGNWLLPGPIHPTGNYITTFHKSGGSQFFRTVDGLNGSLGTNSANSPHLVTPAVYPERGNCVFSSNGNYLYCSNNENFNGSHEIRQMSITPTNMAYLSPTSVTTDTFNLAGQGPKWLEMHPTGNYLFVQGRLNIIAYSVNTVTGIINPTAISTLPNPNSCTSNVNFQMIVLNSTSNMLYAICAVDGRLGSYPVSPTGVLSSPTLFNLGVSNENYKLLFVDGG